MHPTQAIKRFTLAAQPPEGVIGDPVTLRLGDGSVKTFKDLDKAAEWMHHNGILGPTKNEKQTPS